jgi:acyl-CoA thioesterase I
MTFALLLASGLALFVGAPVVGVLGALPVPHSARTALLQRIGMIVGVLLLFVTDAPTPRWLNGALALAVLAWLLTRRGALASRTMLLRAARAGVPLVTALIVAPEIHHQFLPVLPAGTHTQICVLGDSLSAEAGAVGTPWPGLLQAQHGVAVRNLAVPGATTGTARAQADRIAAEPGVVVVLIGGNDLVQGRPAREFGRDLAYILERVTAGGRPVVMFELPRVPGYGLYGDLQRVVAKHHDVRLIPRWRLALLLATPGATSDGLHLSAEGHAALADLVWRCVEPALGATVSSNSVGLQTEDARPVPVAPANGR